MDEGEVRTSVLAVPLEQRGDRFARCCYIGDFEFAKLVLVLRIYDDEDAVFG